MRLVQQQVQLGNLQGLPASHPPMGNDVFATRRVLRILPLTDNEVLFGQALHTDFAASVGRSEVRLKSRPKRHLRRVILEVQLDLAKRTKLLVRKDIPAPTT